MKKSNYIDRFNNMSMSFRNYAKILLLLGLIMSIKNAYSYTEIGTFADFEPPSSPNNFLVCPENTCQHADELAPQFAVSVSELKSNFDLGIQTEPRVEKLTSVYPNDTYRTVYVQRSFLFRFPDYITVQFISIDDKTSSLIIYSTSKYGYYDFGVNKRRVKRWIDLLQHEIAK